MPRRSNSFNCKLNKHYKDALKSQKKREVSLREIADHFGESLAVIKGDETYWRDEYKYETQAAAADAYYGSSTNCCGIDELVFEGIIDCVVKNDATTRALVANHIKRMYNNDKRVLFVGLPLKHDGDGESMYSFKNYNVLRKILLKFGFVQAHTRPYKNSNSSNMLSVLVGQFP